MAIYTFENPSTNDMLDVECKISEYDEMKASMEEQGYVRVIKPIRTVGEGTGDIYSKSDDGWKDMLRTIKAGSGKNNTIPV